MSEFVSCCAASRQAPTLVDRNLPGVTLRQIPGSVCLACGCATASEVVPGEDMLHHLARVFEGDLSTCVVTRANHTGTERETCARCGRDRSSALIDLGIGPRAQIVLRAVPGRFCWTCQDADLDLAELASRLQQWPPQGEATCTPSLLYATPSHPRSIQIELTTRCNLACEYCTNRLLEDPRDADRAEIEAWLDRIDFGVVGNVDFTGLGEPLLYPHLAAVIASVRRRGAPASIRLVTNGTALTPKVFVPLCEAGLTSIAISIDSADPERVSLTRGARLAPILENIRELVRYRDTVKRELEIKLKCVLLGDTSAEVEGLLQLSRLLDVEMPHFSRLDSRDVAQQHYSPELADPLDDERATRLIDHAAARWRELGGRPLRWIPEWDTRGEFVHPDLAPRGVCRWAIDAAYITNRGRGLPCCEQMMDLPRHEHGDLAVNTMRELWKGELLLSHRLPLSIGRIPSGCEGCALAPKRTLA